MRLKILLLIIISFIGFISFNGNFLIIAQASSSSSTIFEVLYNKPTCIIVNEDNNVFFPQSFIGQSFWIESNGTVVDSDLDCSRSEGVNEDGDSGVVQCCPAGYSCVNNECILGLITKCDEFAIQSECEDKNHNELLANKELDDIVSEDFAGGCEFWKPFGDFCAEYVSCKCEWDSGNSKCYAKSDHRVQDLTSNLPLTSWNYENLPPNIESICKSVNQPQPQGKCTFDFTYTGSCEAGDEFIRRSWTINWDGIIGKEPLYCADGSDAISCGDVIRLSFFGNFHLLVSILVITSVYFAMRIVKG